MNPTFLVFSFLEQLVSVEIANKLKARFYKLAGIGFGFGYFAYVVYFAFEEFLSKLSYASTALTLRLILHS